MAAGPVKLPCQRAGEWWIPRRKRRAQEVEQQTNPSGTDALQMHWPGTQPVPAEGTGFLLLQQQSSFKFICS